MMKQLEQFFTEDYLKSYDYHELNIEKFRKLIEKTKVADPLTYLLELESKVGVPYQKYLYVKAMESKLRGNGKNFEKVQEYWGVWVRE
jgi:hypothetical protein